MKKSIKDISKNIIFVDGHCLICNKLVLFVDKYDKSESIYFSHLQGELAKELFEVEFINNLETVVYIKDGVVFTHSKAVIEILKSIGGLWNFFIIFSPIPQMFRDRIYMLVSKNRYSIGKKLETCPIPTGSLKRRFLS